MSDFGNMLQIIGRKDHRCEWCGQSIPKGESHKQYKGIWEGEWQNWKMHDECYADAQEGSAFQEGFMPYEAERPRINFTNSA